MLLHACCHNPTGVDLTRAQWDALIPVLRERELLPYLDLAYQGYGDGIDEDAYALRALRARPTAGALLHRQLVLEEHERLRRALRRAQRRLRRAGEAELVLGQLKATVRRNYSSPPIHGGQIVAAVLSEPGAARAWEAEVAAMRERIQAMRKPARRARRPRCRAATSATS